MFFANSLFKKTFLLIVSIVIAVVLLFSYSMIHNQQNALLEVLYSKASTIAKSIALATSDAMVTNDDSYIVEHIQKVLQDSNEIKYIIVTRKGGESIYNEIDHWNILDVSPSYTEKLNDNTAKGKIITNTIKSVTDEKLYHFTYPVVFSGITWGWISLGLSLEQYNKNMQSIYKDSLLLVFSMLLASMLFSYIITRWLVKPILLLNAAAKKIALGDLGVKVDIEQKGEIGELATSFNHMVGSLKKSDMQLRGYNDELEQRVKERTEALNLLNEQLDQRVKEEVLKRAEQEQILIQQSRFAAMGEMIGNIAHQWRQPLNALGLLMQNVEYAYENDLLNDAYILKAVEKSNKLTESMSQTIDDFRNFFKPNKEFELFSYAQAYESTMGMIGSSLTNNAIEVKENIDTNVCINGFMSEFSQVLLNILNNAKDALVENRETNRLIEVSIHKDEDFAYFTISDNAGGIKDEIVRKVFDPYFTTKEEGKGTGIGLYMSKTIIENSMHGKLSVKNLNDGACFGISIKLASCLEKENR